MLKLFRNCVIVLPIAIYLSAISSLVHTVRLYLNVNAFFTCVFIPWNGLYVGSWKCSHGAICPAYNAFLCAMSHMNGFHTHSVQL